MKALNYRAAGAGGRFFPWLNALRNQSGAYVIRDAGSRQVLYVGESHTGRLGKTIKRHFHAWRDDPERRHRTYNRERVEIGIRLTPPGTASAAQVNLIRRLDPRDNGFRPAEEPF